MDEEIGDVELDDTENQPSTSKVKMITPIDLSGVGSPVKGGGRRGMKNIRKVGKMEKIKSTENIFPFFPCLEGKNYRGGGGG